MSNFIILRESQNDKMSDLLEILLKSMDVKIGDQQDSHEFLVGLQDFIENIEFVVQELQDNYPVVCINTEK